MLSTDTSLELIEELLNGDCKCESDHGNIKVGCSEEVTHRFIRGCGPVEKLVCSNTAQYVQQCSNDPGSICPVCIMRISDCWRILPV